MPDPNYIYPTQMPPALMPQPGALTPPMPQNSAQGLLTRALLPFYDALSKGARQPGVPLTPQQVNWDEYVKSILNPQPGPTSPLQMYINGNIVPNNGPQPNMTVPSWIGVRG